jgi:(p)ppGpp synthase/HD superfamily hydrolase
MISFTECFTIVGCPRRGPSVVITTGDADHLATWALADRLTSLGGRHIEHARRVAAAVVAHGDRTVVAALLHDTVEKGRIAWPELVAAVGDDDVVRVIDALTCREGETELDYLRRCAQVPAAAVIKRADLLDKLDPPEIDAAGDGGAAIRRRARERLALLHRLVDENEA